MHEIGVSLAEQPDVFPERRAGAPRDNAEAVQRQFPGKEPAIAGSHRGVCQQQGLQAGFAVALGDQAGPGEEALRGVADKLLAILVDGGAGEDLQVAKPHRDNGRHGGHAPKRHAGVLRVAVVAPAGIQPQTAEAEARAPLPCHGIGLRRQEAHAEHELVARHDPAPVHASKGSAPASTWQRSALSG